jgi:hypothetical protein
MVIFHDVIHRNNISNTIDNQEKDMRVVTKALVAKETVLSQITVPIHHSFERRINQISL